MLLPFLTIFFTAAAFLAYEILLMRLLSIINWSHYAYMVVSLAMLGIGFSGVILALFPKFFKRWRNEIIFSGCFLFSFTIPFVFYLNQKLPLNYLYLIWDWHQFVYLGISYLLYGIPFLIVSTILAIFFLYYPKKTGQVYAVNLLGSGCGILLAVGIMYLIPPEKYLAITGILAALAGCLWGLNILSGPKKIWLLLLFIVTVFIQFNIAPPSLLPYLSEYKGLAQILRLPDTKIILSKYSPLGLIHVLQGKSIRLAPGLSIKFKDELPPQKALTIDGSTPLPIIQAEDNLSSLTFLDHRIYAAGYHLVKKPAVLIIGAGGGSDVLLAGYHQSPTINILEMNNQIITAVEKVLGKSYQQLSPRSAVKLIIKEARGYLQTTHKTFDLIQLNPPGTLAASASGVYSQNEDYLNTVESYQLFYQRLTPRGMVVISRWLKTPARDGIKLFATALESLKRSEIEQPEKQLALIRNWDMLTLLIKKTPFTPKELQKLKRFCRQRNFDICYFPGIKKEDVGRFHQLPTPAIYYHSAQNIIDPAQAPQFFAAYPFQIKPATDDKPYFANFFRWSALPHLIRTLGKEWLPFAEHGYIGLLATFIQAMIIGGLIILLPLSISLYKQKVRRSFKTSWWFYFIFLGFSYLLLEIALIQKFILFLHHPIYSTAAIIATFLLVSGLGSLFSQKLLQKNRKVQILPFLVIIILGVFYAFALDTLFAQCAWAGLTLRLVISFLVIAPLAFFMGMPFPFGMQKIVVTGEQNTGRAWGYNGFFSVMGAVAAPILASLLGFKIVAILGSLGYLAAMIIWLRNLD